MKSAYVTPLLKGSNPNNYRPISKLSALAKVLEGLISDQLKDYLETKNILNDLQSGFRKKHSTVTATMKVLNDFISVIDSKEYCVALFLDLSKAFDTVDHYVLAQRLVDIGMSPSSLKMLDSVYHASLRFVTKSSFRTHHCSLYESVGWLSLHNRRLEHWYIYLFKAILYKLPSYLCSLLTLKVTTSKSNLRSYGQIMYDIPRTRTVFGESAFKVFAPLSWYKLQNNLKLDYLPSMTQFKIRMKDYLSTICTCAITECCW